jgi:hypothetical protein
VHLLSLSDAKIPSALRPVSVPDAELIEGRGLRRARQDGQFAGGRDQPVPRSVAVGRAKRDSGADCRAQELSIARDGDLEQPPDKIGRFCNNVGLDGRDRSEQADSAADYTPPAIRTGRSHSSGYRLTHREESIYGLLRAAKSL